MLECEISRAARRLLFSIKWESGDIPGTLEARLPDGLEPFAASALLRDSDASKAAYACQQRGADWYVVCIPAEPEPLSVFFMSVKLKSARLDKWCGPVNLYGPTRQRLGEAVDKLDAVAPREIIVIGSPIFEVDYGADCEPGGFEYDGRNEAAVAVLFRDMVTYLRRVYPVGIPENATIAARIKSAFSEL